jgi:ribosomal protein L10
MSKQIKQMEMDTLKHSFDGVRDLVLLSVKGLTSQTDNHLRLTLRKKNVRLHWVKNSLARRVFGEIGVTLDKVWEGPTLFAWGSDSIKGLSKELDAIIKDLGKKDPKIGDKIKIKTAVADGQQVTFEQALKMPTRLEAIGEIIGMILGPASEIAAMLTGPASQIASQIETISKKEPESAPAA